MEVEQSDREPPALAAGLTEAMERICAADGPIRSENWPTDEAIRYFQDRGWEDAVLLLRTRRLATVRLVSCGELYALSPGPLLPSTGALRGFRLEADAEGLWLELGQRDPRLMEPELAAPGHSHAQQAHMIVEHQRWLSAMGVTSVGAFLQLCISGQVSQLIRVAEGFHEKQIGQVADRVAAARDRIRIISIAGPSSSGKTTFIKRLTVQLQIDGVNPVAIGLDNYYVDREKTPGTSAASGTSRRWRPSTWGCSRITCGGCSWARRSRPRVTTSSPASRTPRADRASS